MEIVVFYSWQMKTDVKKNKNYIKGCIEKAIKKISNKQTPELRGVEYLLQESTNNISGSPPIVSNIIDDRIPRCDIFIADLSVTDPLGFLDKLRFGKKRDVHQANNVIFEYGIAYNAIGSNLIIGVLNKAYGSPNDNSENIPFDLRGMRFPMEYEYEINKDSFINNLSKAIKACTLTALQVKKDRFKPFISWNEFSERQSAKSKFLTNERIEEIKIKLSGATSDIRLLGLSGLGKTRMVFESFRRGDELESLTFLYCEYQPSNEINIQSGLRTIIKDPKNKQAIIVDNCPLEFFRTLLKIKREHSSTNPIISIHNEPEELLHDTLIDVEYVKLTINDLDDVVDKLIDELFQNTSDQDKQTIKEFSEGIPLMTVLLAQNYTSGNTSLGIISDKELFLKLLSINDEKELELLKVFSIFRFIGFDGDLQDQIEYIISNKDLTPISAEKEEIMSKFQGLLRRFAAREIFEISGRYFGIRPRPLAFYLASLWFEGCDSRRLARIADNFQDTQNPIGNALVEPLTKQINYMGDNLKVKELISKLVGENAPFHNAKVLNTELGSRLFRSFVEVNPEAIADCLYSLFSNQSIEDLKLIEEGRRNLVWTLEKVCFDKRTFTKGAKVLMAFSVAENEKLANNATGVFLQLFRLLLPGTQADLSERLSIIKWGLEIENTKFNIVALEAINSAFKSESFSYVRGAEKQGTKTLEHYSPDSLEIHKYWDSLLEIISTQIMSSDFEISSRASEILATRLRHIVNLRATEKLFEVLSETIEYKENEWDELLDPLYDLTNYEKGNLANDELDTINSYIVKLTKNDFLSRFKEIDKQRRRKYRDLSFEESLNIRRQEYSKLAEEFLKLEREKQSELLKSIFEDKDIFPVGFGKKLAELVVDDPKLAKWLVESSISIFKSGERQYNTFIFLDFCQSLSENQFAIVTTRLSKEDNLSTLLFPMLAKRNIAFGKIGILFELINSSKATVKHFSFFFDNAIITPDKDSQIHDLLNQLQKYGQDGRDVIILVAYRNIFPFISVDESYPQVLNLVLDVLSTTSLKDLNSDDIVIKLTAKILSLPAYSDLAKHIIQELIKLAETSDTMFSFDYQVENLFSLLIENYFEIIWPDLSQALLSENDKYIVFHNLKSLLGSLNGSYGKRGLLFYDEGKNQKIIEWAKENLALAPERLASMIPVFQGKNFSSMALALLDNFGNDNRMLSAFDANMRSFSWVGSTVPFYEDMIEVLKTLLSHKNESVVSWAKIQIEYTKNDLAREKRREDEERLFYGT